MSADWFAVLPADVEVAEAEPEVRLHDPRAALVAPKAGLADLETDSEKIIAGAAKRCASGGWLALETGIAQHPALLATLAASGLREGESRKDLSGRDRFVLGRK